VKRRTIFKLLLFLLAGAIINVAVAWGCIHQSGFGKRTNYDKGVTFERYQHLWIANAPPGFSRAAKDLGYYAEFLGYWHCRLDNLYPDQPLGDVELDRNDTRSYETADFLSVGLPLHSLEGRVFRCNAASGRMIDNKSVGVIVLERKSGPMIERTYWIPIIPIFPGFAINTIFYAAIVYALFAVPGAVRRRVRIKRGQCASCGYSLRESVSEKCPECGAASANEQATPRGE
jgi:hypothetical protein